MKKAAFVMLICCLLLLQTESAAQTSSRQISLQGFEVTLDATHNIQRNDMPKLHERLLDIGINIVKVDTAKRRILIYTLDPISQELADKATILIKEFFSKPEAPGRLRIVPDKSQPVQLKF